MGSHIEVKNLEDFLSSVEGGAFEKEKIRNMKEELRLYRNFVSIFILRHQNIPLASNPIKFAILWVPDRVQITKKNSENFSRGWKRHATLKI